MSRRGRPGKGAELVSELDGSQQARQRLKIILRTLSGALTVEHACAELGIGRSGFHKLRRQFLVQATELLEPRPHGRQRRVPTDADQRVAHLQAQIVQLKLDLKAQQIREEIALVMPHLLMNKSKSARKKRPGSGTRNASVASVR